MASQIEDLKQEMEDGRWRGDKGEGAPLTPRAPQRIDPPPSFDPLTFFL